MSTCDLVHVSPMCALATPYIAPYYHALPNLMSRFCLSTPRTLSPFANFFSSSMHATLAYLVEPGSFRMVESLKICSTPRVAAAASACRKQGGANHSAHYPSRAKRQSPIPIPRVCQRIRATRFSLLDSLLLDAEEMLRGMSDKGISFAA